MGEDPGPGPPGVPCRACQRCGAHLRPGWPGTLCELCSARPLDIAGLLREAGFFTREPVRRALAGYDFGYLFRAVRRAAGLAQQELGDVLGLDQDRISRIERGERRLRDIVIIARVASRLGIPPVLLGFTLGTVSVEWTGAGEIREVDWVRRRDFSWIVAGIVLGGVDALDADRLDALLPAGPTASRAARIGAADVAVIEQATALFRRSDFSHGGGICRPVVVAKLRSVLALRHASCISAVRERLMVATADLGLVAAWSSYDAERHNDARRLFLLAVSVAQQAEHPRSADLAAHLLMDMAHQSLHLRQPQEALSLVQLGYGTAARRAQPLSASTASHLASYQAWGQAALSEARACDRAVGQVIEHFTHVDPDTAAPWAARITIAELAAMQGHAQYTLALASADPKHAARAVPLLGEAVEGFGPTYARSRAVNLPGLAGAHALTGDLDTAARAGHRAVEEITALASPRAYDRLRTLETVLQPHDSTPAISEVCHQIQAALVTA
jgi:transcriptional regulator with XRE-family HTH domain